MDAQSSLDDVAALAALVQALALRGGRAPRRPTTAERGARLVELPRRPRRHCAATCSTAAPCGRSPRSRATPSRALRPFARELGDEDALDGSRAHPRAGRRRGAPAARACAGRVPRGARDARRGHRAAGRGATRARVAALARRAVGARPRAARRAHRRGTPSGPARSTARSSGRDAVVGHVEPPASATTDAFSTELLAYEARGDNRAVARIRNVAARNGDELDSLQALVFEEAGGLVSSVASTSTTRTRSRRSGRTTPSGSRAPRAALRGSRASRRSSRRRGRRPPPSGPRAGRAPRSARPPPARRSRRASARRASRRRPSSRARADPLDERLEAPRARLRLGAEAGERDLLEAVRVREVRRTPRGS